MSAICFIKAKAWPLLRSATGASSKNRMCLADASGHGYAFEAATAKTAADANPRRAALADFCHALLNASEFLYVE